MNKLTIFFFIATMTSVIACNKGYPGGYGWNGWGPEPYLLLPKPTLIPKLKKAFLEGKLSVNYHKIVAPSLKPLPYIKGCGWIHKGCGWGHHLKGIGHFGHLGPIGHGGYGHGGFGHGGYGHGGGYGYGFPGYGYGGIGKSGYVGVGLGKGPFGKGVGLYSGQFKGPIGPNVGHGHIPVTPYIPIAPKFPVPHGPHGFPIGHGGHGHHGGHSTVSEHVTVVEKGVGGVHHHGAHLPPVGPGPAPIHIDGIGHKGGLGLYGQKNGLYKK